MPPRVQYLWSCAAVLLFLQLPGMAFAQERDSSNAAIEAIDQAYRRLEYDRAEALARDALANSQHLTVDELTELHRLLAIVQISQNDRQAARRQFEAALSLDPNLTLDPTFVSPKIIDFYEKVRRSYLATAGATGADSLAVRYRMIQDPRPSAALRSALLPGWGQFYLDQPGRGRLFMGVWAASTAGALFSHFMIDRGSGTSSGPITWKRTRSGLALAAAGTWAVSYLYALIGPIDESPRVMRFGIRPGRESRVRASLRIRF